MKETEYVTIIGGCNIDITGFPYNKLNFSDSNPGAVKLSHGGVGRNIAENLSKMKVKSNFISIVGDDLYGRSILDHLENNNINIRDTLISDNTNTSIYLSVLDQNNDMKVAISYMEILDKLSVEYICSKRATIEKSTYIILDTNLNKEVIEHLLKNYNNKFIIDTVSTAKAIKIKNLLHRIYILKLNKLEAERLSNIKINNYDDLIKTGEYFLNKGTKNIFITLGDEGVYYVNSKSSGKIKASNVKVINANGAGDAFTASLAYCYLNKKDIEETVKFSIASSVLALQHENTINPNLSIKNIEKIKKELSLC